MSIVERARVALRNWINKPSADELAERTQRLLDLRREELGRIREQYAGMSPDQQTQARADLGAQVARLRADALASPDPVLGRWIEMVEAELEAMRQEAAAQQTFALMAKVVEGMATRAEELRVAAALPGDAGRVLASAGRRKRNRSNPPAAQVPCSPSSTGADSPRVPAGQNGSPAVAVTP